MTNCHRLEKSLFFCQNCKRMVIFDIFVFLWPISIYMRHCGDSVPTMSDIYTLCMCWATVRKFRPFKPAGYTLLKDRQILSGADPFSVSEIIIQRPAFLPPLRSIRDIFFIIKMCFWTADSLIFNLPANSVRVMDGFSLISSRISDCLSEIISLVFELPVVSFIMLDVSFWPSFRRV